MKTVLAAAFVAALLTLPGLAQAQTAPAAYAPPAAAPAATGSSGVYLPPSATSNGVYLGESTGGEPRTRANPVHWVGFGLGIAGVVGGAFTLLTGLFVALFGGPASPFLLTGAIILPVGGLAMITSGILLATDRIPVEEDVEFALSLQPTVDGARAELRLAF